MTHYQILSIPKGLVWHKIIVIGGWAIHNGPDHHIVIEKLDRALAGKEPVIEKTGWSDLSELELIHRAQSLSQFRKYKLGYNCEDFIEELLGNAPKSAQRNVWIAAFGFVAIIAIAARA